MPVEAPFYFVLDEDIIYFGAYSILRYRRIVEKHDRLAAERDSAFYRCAEPSRLAQKNFFVRVLLRVKEPAASAANGDVADGHRAVVDYRERFKALFFEKIFHFPGGVPPVVVIALHEYFFAGKRVEKSKIFLSTLERHRPRHIAGNNYRVAVRDNSPPIFFEALHIVAPAVEYIHRLVRGQGKMRIRNCKK